MSVAVAVQMTFADLLKLRKKRGAMVWATLLALAPLIIFFAVKAIQHSSNPVTYGPAGGYPGYHDGLRLLAMFFGPLAAILIGVEAGTSDLSAGVFRDLVVTGRSRLALFATRVPAALTVCFTIMAVGFGLLMIGTFAFAGSLPTPSGSLVLEGIGFTALETGVVCVVSVGFASLTGSRPAAITALIGWQLIASPLIGRIGSLGKVRDLVLSEALAHFSPLPVGGGPSSTVAMATGTAIAVIVVWLAVLLVLGAWRTRQMEV